MLTLTSKERVPSELLFIFSKMELQTMGIRPLLAPYPIIEYDLPEPV
jgi:hypothetical protein